MLLAFGLTVAAAGEARLKSGFVIEGKPVPLQGLTNALAEQSAGPTTVYPILMIDNGKQRYFVAARQVDEVNHAADLSKYEKFKLRQKLSGRKLTVQSLGGFKETPFDEFGRRTVTINTNKGSLSIVQGITEITPRYVTIAGLTHVWEHARSTSSIPPKTLDAMIRKVTNQTNPDERLAIARFYLQAGLYFPAADELDSIVRDFPELKSTVQEVTVQLQQLQAKQLLSELRRRKAAGQEQLAYAAAKAFPTENMSAEVLREVRDLILGYEDDRAKGTKVVNRMGDLQAELVGSKNAEKRSAEAGPIRSAIAEALDVHSLDRLDAFLQNEADPTLPPADKLALAFSGWVIGGANADTDFNKAADLWKARHYVLEYLRSDDARQRSDLIRGMRALDFTPQKLLQMIPVLPPPVETQGIEPGKPFRIEVAGKNEGEVLAAYHVLLPQEYSPNRRYPLIVALCGFGNPRDELAWWGRTFDGKAGQSQRHGYIVVAPEWLAPELREYDYGVESHLAVQRTLRDARQRFIIDSDRVFLSGHGSGGDAAFDIGMSHPDLFAGVVPIAGFSDKYCKWYWPNAKFTAWYVIAGELDRDSMARNARDINRMLKYGHDLVYTEYVGRGFEDFYEEIHRLFEWMDLHHRQPQPAEIDVKVLRTSDDRFFWYRANNFPPNVTQAAVLADDPSSRSRINPMNVNVRATEGNSIYIQSGPPSGTLWLTPDLVDFEKRVLIRQGGRQKFNDFVTPSLEVILEDLRLRGDRERVYQAEINVD